MIKKKKDERKTTNENGKKTTIGNKDWDPQMYGFSWVWETWT